MGLSMLPEIGYTHKVSNQKGVALVANERMELTVKENLEAAANVAQSVATALLNGNDRIEDFAARLTAMANELRDLAKIPGVVILVGNLIDGMRIIGPWLDVEDAANVAADTRIDHYTIVELESTDNL